MCTPQGFNCQPAANFGLDSVHTKMVLFPVAEPLHYRYAPNGSGGCVCQAIYKGGVQPAARRIFASRTPCTSISQSPLSNRQFYSSKPIAPNFELSRSILLFRLIRRPSQPTMQCPSCHGNGTIKCDSCGGSSKNCNDCKKGQQVCNVCEGAGAIHADS